MLRPSLVIVYTFLRFPEIFLYNTIEKEDEKSLLDVAGVIVYFFSEIGSRMQDKWCE